MSFPLIRAISRAVREITESGTHICYPIYRRAGQALQRAQRRIESVIHSPQAQEFARTAGLGLMMLSPASRPIATLGLAHRYVHFSRKELPGLIRQNYGRPISVQLTPGGRKAAHQVSEVVRALFNSFNIYISPFGTESYYPTIARGIRSAVQSAVIGGNHGAVAAAGTQMAVHHFHAVPMDTVVGEDNARDILENIQHHNRTAHRNQNVTPNENQGETLQRRVGNHPVNQ